MPLKGTSNDSRRILCFGFKEEESQNLKSQIVISSWGGRRYLPFLNKPKSKLNQLNKRI